MKLTSPAFREGDPIPAKYTCEGADVSPPLRWNDAPPGTSSFALLCEDPDAPAGLWVHWVLHGIPAGARELAEHVPTVETLADGSRQGTTDFQRVGYGGPCPPPGKPHRYFFRLYALDREPSVPPRARRADLLKAMHGHVLGEASLMGTFQRHR